MNTNYDEILEMFQKTEDKDRLLTLDNFENLATQALFSSLKTCITEHYSQFHIQSHVCSILSQFSIYSNTHILHTQPNTDSIAVQIINYIKTNYTQNINLEILEKKFFVSKTTINTIIKKMSGMIFWEYVTNLR